MKTIIKQIPNTITCLNLLAGCMACVAAFYGEYDLASYFIILAAVFDFADGFAARLLRAYSPLGKELDSLADMVSFGVAPAIMLFSFLAQHDFLLALVAFLLTVFSALRLAKFNIDKRQTDSFIGLPTPANAFFWAFLLKDAHSQPVFSEEQMRIVSHSVHIGDFAISYSLFFVIITVLIGVFCYLMISEIPMFSLKFSSFGWKKNELRYVFLAVSLVALVLIQTAAFPLIIGIYILLSLFSTIFCKKKADPDVIVV